MPHEDARLEAELEIEHGKLRRSLRRCREIVSDCRSKLTADCKEADETWDKADAMSQADAMSHEG